MGVINYYTTNGEIVGDSAIGDYMRDALGSVTGTTSPSTGAVQNTYRYKPFGDHLSQTGIFDDPKFQWIGTAGYRQTPAAHSASYVRMRHYGQEEGRWLTSDPLWPRADRYTNCYNNPTLFTDPSGLEPISIWFHAFLHKRHGLWIAEPIPPRYTSFYFRGDNRGFGEIGTSRISSVVSIDSCSIGAPALIKNFVGVSHRKNIITGDEWAKQATVVKDFADPRPNVKEVGGPCYSGFRLANHAAYPFFPPAAPTKLGVQGRFTVVGKNSVMVHLKFAHSPFPDWEVIVEFKGRRWSPYKYDTPFPDWILMANGIYIDGEETLSLPAGTDCCCTEVPCCIGECPCS